MRAALSGENASEIKATLRSAMAEKSTFAAALQYSIFSFVSQRTIAPGTKKILVKSFFEFLYELHTWTSWERV
jgi:hypothetical protein